MYLTKNQNPQPKPYPFRGQAWCTDAKERGPSLASNAFTCTTKYLNLCCYQTWTTNQSLPSSRKFQWKCHYKKLALKTTIKVDSLIHSNGINYQATNTCCGVKRAVKELTVSTLDISQSFWWYILGKLQASNIITLYRTSIVHDLE